MKKKRSLSLKKRAVENTTITKGRDKEVVKEGVPLEHAPRHGVPLSSRSVGMSKGVTKNMGDFESFRVDVWLTDYVLEGETHEEALERVEAIVNETLENAVFSILDE